MSFKDEFSKAFGSLANAVGDAAKATADKAKQMSELAKLNLKISAEEDKIKKAQVELGKRYYEDFEAGNPIEGENYLPICEKIRGAKEAIAQCREAIASLKAEKEEKVEEKEESCCCQEAAEEEACCCQETAAEEPCCCQEAAAEEPCCCCQEKPAEEPVNIEFTVVDEKPEETAE